PWEILTQGTILFIEDVNTKPFQVDRMLRHLMLAGKFRGVRGIIFGEMKDCAQPGQSYSLQDVIRRVLEDLDIPVAFGLRSGHISRKNITLPLGVQARLEVGKQVTLEILVVGNAISRGNVELEQVLDERIAMRSLPQVLQEYFLRTREPIVVAGTHGKTTTTSMLAWIFQVAGLEPSFLIGGIAENFGSSFALRQGKHFIIEGDEYDTAFFDKGPKFLHYMPRTVLLTHVEFDHADIYADLEAVKTSFKRLINLVPRRG